MKKKIIHIIPRLNYTGGIENYVRTLVSSNNSEFQIGLITFYDNNDERILLDLANSNIKIKTLTKCLFEKNDNSFLSVILRNLFYHFIIKSYSLKRYLQQENPDLIITHGEDSELLYSLISKNSRAINVIHSSNEFPTNPLYKFIILNYSRKKYDYTFTVCESLKGKSKLHPDKTTSIKTGVELQNFYTEHIKNNKQFTIGFIGRLSKEKGVINLVEAFIQFLRSKKNINLVIAGTGKQERNIRAKIPNDLRNYIRFSGDVRNPISFYKKMDLLVLPSYIEGFPLVIIEAMAAKVLVVANNVGGIKEIVIHNKNGILLKNNEPQTILNNLVEVLDLNSEQRNSMVNNAFKTVQKYSADQFLNEFNKAIKNVLYN